VGCLGVVMMAAGYIHNNADLFESSSGARVNVTLLLGMTLDFSKLSFFLLCDYYSSVCKQVFTFLICFMGGDGAWKVYLIECLCHHRGMKQVETDTRGFCRCVKIVIFREK
jgi:hypothetical protein